jgi:serine/threonine-protein kinase
VRPDTAERLVELVEAALARPAGERPAFLDEACRTDDAALRAEAESLLRYHERAASFIEQPAFPSAAELPAGGEGLAAGALVGDYRIVRLIGEGGMGEVYLAEDTKLARPVAIKLVRRAVATRDVLRHFAHEERILASLNSPYIARLYGGGVAPDGAPYFVMEYVEGEPLTDYCEARGLSTEGRLRLFVKVCAAVQYAHQHLVVHRDLKPSNILVTEDGEPKLLDFGIAKLLDDGAAGGEAQTVTRLGVMTPQYASPEQVRGQPATTPSDVYSLGVVLYELLTGARPYRVASLAPQEIARAVCGPEPERPSAAVGRGAARPGARPSDAARLSRRLAGDLDNIVLTAMRKDPRRRYQSAAQLSEDIRRHLEGLPVSARKDTLAYRASKFVGRHRAAAAAAALASVALAGGGVATAWEARVAARQRDSALAAKAKAERLSTFLKNVLTSPDPTWNAGGARGASAASLGDVLEEASRRAASELAGQPDDAASVELAIGVAYKGRAVYDRAEPHLRAAQAMYEKLYGGQSAEAFTASYALAQCLFLRGDYAAAEPLYRAAVEFYRGRYAAGDKRALPAMVGSTNDLAYLLRLRGYDAESESLLREALRYAPLFSGNERALVAIPLGHLGLALDRQGDAGGAEACERRSVEEFRRLPGGDRMELGTSLVNLGQVLAERGDYAGAEGSIREGLEVYRRWLGDSHPYYALGLDRLARLLYLKGDYAAAERIARQAVGIQKRALPEGHPAAADTLTTLGLILTKTGRAAEAEQRLRAALAIRSRVLRAGHALIAEDERALDECLKAHARGRTARASESGRTAAA